MWRRRVAAGSLLLLLLLLLLAIAALLIVRLEPLQRHYNNGLPQEVEFGAGSDLTRRAGLCSVIDLSVFTTGKACGLPLSAPCFNNTRCASLPLPTMYVYDYSCSLADSSLMANATAQNDDDRDRSGAIWRTAAANAGLLAEKYDSACLFIHVNQRVDEEPCASGAPLWSKGSNHVMVDLTDNSR